MGIRRDFDGKIRQGAKYMGSPAVAVAVPQPNLEAHRKATAALFPEIVEGLVSIIGRKLTASIASIRDARALDRWMQDAVPHKDVEARLRLAYQVASLLSGFDSPAIVQAWFIGLNPELDDEVPLSLLRDGNLEEVGKRVLSAARAFVAGG